MNFSCGPSSRFNPDPEAKENGKMQAFLRLQWRKSCKCSFTAANSSGKSARQLFLRSERRKSGKCGLTASSSSGKAALRLFLRSGRRKSSRCNFTAPDSSGKPAWQLFLRFEGRKGCNSGMAARIHIQTFPVSKFMSLISLSALFLHTFDACGAHF